MKINVSNKKYTFTSEACVIKVLRHGEQWHEQSDASNAITSLMYELDAARVVLAAVRAEVANGTVSEQSRLGQALKLHDALVDDREEPSEWAAG